MNLTVRGYRIFIRPDKLPEQSSSGLHLVHDRSNSTMRGTVVAVGDGPQFVRNAVDGVLDGLVRFIDNKYVVQAIEEARARFNSEHLVNVGDRVLFSPDTGEELIFEKDLLVAMKEDDILAVVDSE